MDDRIPLLCPLFCDLPEERFRQALLPRGRLRRLAPGETLIAPQEQVDWFGIVLEGHIRILQASLSNGLMENLYPSFAVGADLLFTKNRRSPYRAAAAAAAQVMIFPGEVLTGPEVLTQEEQLLVYRRLLTLISQSNMRKYNRLDMLSRRGLRDRILTYLTLQAARRDEDSFQISFSREEMAGFLCVNRSALSHELSLMEQEGLIRFRKNQFTLLSEQEPL